MKAGMTRLVHSRPARQNSDICVGFARLEKRRARHREPAIPNLKSVAALRRKRRETLPAGGNLQLRLDVAADLVGIEVDEAADAVIRDATQLRPFAEGADRRLLSFRKDAADPQPQDIGEARLVDRWRLRVHAARCTSTVVGCACASGAFAVAGVAARCGMMLKNSVASAALLMSR